MSQITEEWKSVVGYEGLYEVSSIGRLRRQGGNLLRLYPIRGYRRICLWKHGISRYWYAHRIVAAAFIGPIPPGHEVNHLNGDKADNSVENLEYVTPKQNIQHAIATGLDTKKKKLSDEDVRMVRQRLKETTATLIAKELGVSRNLISEIKHGRQRVNVT